MGPVGTDAHGCAPSLLGQQDPPMALQPMEQDNSSSAVLWGFLGQELLTSAAPGAAAAELGLQMAFWGMFP